MKTLIRFGLGLLFAITVIACSSGGGPEGSGSLNPEENNGKSPVETGALAISISVPQSTVFSDDSISITAKVSGDGAEDAIVEWVATGGTLGEKSVTGAKWTAPTVEGDYTITATASHAGASVTDEVTISVELDPSRNYLIVSANLPDGTTTTFDQEVALAAAIRGPDANNAQFEWELVQGVGHVFPKAGDQVTWDSGNKVGDTTIRITATAGSDVLKRDLELKVIVPLEIVGVTPANPQVGIGNEVELEVELGGYYADDARVSWTYSSMALEDPNNPGALRGALIGDSTNRTIAYRAPHLHAVQSTIENLSESVSVIARHLDSQTQTDPFKVDVNVTFCDAGDWQTAADPCLISNVYQLQGIGDSGDMLSGHYMLSADIDAAVTDDWTDTFKPIGGLSPFKGSLDGAGYTIENLTVRRSGESGIGLFGAISGATVRDLTISNSKFYGVQVIGSAVGVMESGALENVQLDSVAVSGQGVIGGLIGVAGWSQNSPINIRNITATEVNVTQTRDNVWPSGDPLEDGLVGGLIGLIGTGQIEDMSITDSVVLGRESYVGGVFGLVGPAVTASDIRVSDTGVSNTMGNHFAIGGLVGENRGKITDSEISGESVSGKGHDIGGFVGRNMDTGEITNSSASDQEVFRDEGYDRVVGGFVGVNDGLIEDSYVANQHVRAVGGAGGFAGGIGVDGIIRDSHVSNSSVTVPTFGDPFQMHGLGGFLVGNNGLIERASVTDTSVAGAHDVVGGFAALNNPSGVIRDSFVYAPNNRISANGEYAGGFVARNRGELSQVYSIVKAVQAYDFVGGLVGELGAQAWIRYSYALGEVMSDGGTSIGGLVGESNVVGQGQVLGSAWTPESSVVQYSKGGTEVSSLALLQQLNTYKSAAYKLYWKFTGDPDAVWQFPDSAVPGPHTPDLINNSRY